MKKSKWVFVRDVLIYYLAISKIMYWMNVITEMAQREFEGAGWLILQRALNRDLPLILIVICFVILDNSKGKLLIKLAIGYGASVAILFAYLWVMSLILATAAIDYLNTFIGYSIGFVVCVVVLGLKEHFLSKPKPEADAQAKEAKDD